MKPRQLVVALGLAGGLLAAGAHAAPDAAALARGEQVYARCAACHAIEGNRTGPQHCGLFECFLPVCRLRLNPEQPAPVEK